VSNAAEWSDRVKSAAVHTALLAMLLAGCNDPAEQPSLGAGGPVLPEPATTLLMDGLLNGGFELVADATTDPPKYGAYWSGAFSTTAGDPVSWVVNDRAFRGEWLLRLSYATTGVQQKIVTDPRWTAALTVSLAVRTYRDGELILSLEDGRGLAATLRVNSVSGVVTVRDERGLPVEPIATLAADEDWSQVVLPLGRLFTEQHGSPPQPRLLLHLDPGGPPGALVDVDEVHAAVSWPALGAAELTLFTRELVRWTLDSWYLPRAAGGLGLVDPESGYVTRVAYHVETGAPGPAARYVSYHTIHDLLMLWLAESRRRGWDQEVARWTPELRRITTTLLTHNFDPRTGLPQNVSLETRKASKDAVTVGNYVEFLLNARELVDDEALASRCLAQARKIADTLVTLQAEHDIPPERAPPPPVWNAKTGQLSGDTSNWFGHIADRLTPQGAIETNKRFRTSWAILTGRSFWYELMRSPRAILRVHSQDPREGDLASVARAIDLYQRDWDASRYDLENDTDDHYGYLCEDLLAPLRTGGMLLPQALALVQAATDHRLSPNAKSSSDTLWVQAVRLGTACAGDSPRAFAGPLELYGMSGRNVYREALLELARNDLQGRQLTNGQFTESFFKDWTMVCICFRGTEQGDCRDKPADYWHGDVGDTFGGPPGSAIDAQTAAYRVATAAERQPVLAGLGIIRHITETTLRRQHGYLYGLDEAVARQYELPEKYVHSLQPVSAAGLAYVMAWMRLLPHLSTEALPPAPRVELVEDPTLGPGLIVHGAAGQLIALPAQVMPIPAPISASDPRLLALDLSARTDGVLGTRRVTIGPDAETFVPLDQLGIGSDPDRGVVQPLLLDPDDHSVLAIGAALTLGAP
jgi:hypothetical protein